LAALTKDEATAPHVNLVPLDLPGDLYKYVGEHVWQHINETVETLPKDVVEDAETLIDNVIDLKKQINSAELRSDRRAELVDKIKKLKTEEDLLLGISAPVFWRRVTDLKHRRKIVKRNTMTLPYGGTAYGLGEQQITDARKHGIDLLMSMEHRWGAYMGRVVFEDCRKSLKRPMQLLSVFEAAGKAAEARGEFLSWTVPLTNFPVVQHYTQGVIKRVYVQYGPPEGDRLSTGYYSNTLQIHICFIEETEPSKGKQSQGASPNAIHSLDAAHLALTVHRCNFPVTTIHDSFGALLSDMPTLYRVVRETFVELYESDPLTSLMNDIKGDLSNVEIGNLDLKLVLKSEYCFS
jgi:DNA-directed RNA polymerase